MEKRDLKKLALLGMTSGLLVISNSHLQAAQSNQNHDNMLAQATKKDAKQQDSSKQDSSKDKYDPNTQNLGYHLMTEDELLLELNEEGKALYNSLDAEGKELARKVASARCQGSNECKGLNACQTDKNSCAGQGSCKAQGKCAVGDKNFAVKLAAKKMQEKRNNSMK